jgi:IBR domain, a half RING-finger domain
MACYKTEDADTKLLKPCWACPHTYCTDCVRQLFVRAVESQLNMPAKCCSMIPLHVGLKYLSKDEAARYRVAFEEWSTAGKDRLYCPKLQCSAFIPLKIMGQARVAAAVAAALKDSKKRDSKDVAVPEPESVVVECPKCSTPTCLVCKNFAHPTEACNFEVKDAALVAQLRKWGYKQCPRCRHGVRKMFGCAHMTCVCGEHFCWNCERNYVQCDNEGDCAGDEDECGSEEEEEEEEEDVDEDEDEEEDEGPAEGASQHQDHTLPFQIVDGSTDPPTVHVATEPLPEEQRRPRRDRDGDNLDAGSDRYWNNQELDFGYEPEEPTNTVWSCTHEWTRNTAADDAATAGDEDEAKVQRECHECWKPVGGKGWKCNWCGTLACDACQIMFDQGLNGSGSEGEA